MNIKELSEIMVAAIGQTQTSRELTIYDFVGNKISTGALLNYTKEDVTDIMEKFEVEETKGLMNR